MGRVGWRIENDAVCCDNLVFNNWLIQSGVGHKIDIRIQSAVKTLHDLIDDGQTGKFDFAFLDANKGQYPEYFTLCMQLLRTGGVLAVDNVSRRISGFLVLI